MVTGYFLFNSIIKLNNDCFHFVICICICYYFINYTLAPITNTIIHI